MVIWIYATSGKFSIQAMGRPIRSKDKAFIVLLDSRHDQVMGNVIQKILVH